MGSRSTLSVVLVLFLAACGTRPEFGALTPVGSEVASVKQHEILVATTRARDARPGTLFNGDRSGRLDFAEVKVGVPPTHVAGRIEWADQPAKSDPAKHFVTTDARYLAGREAFLAEVNAQLARKPAGKRRIMVFVHGYNTMFAEGLYRFAQLVHDSSTPAVPVHFSWPSAGAVSEYVYDNNSATASRDALEQTLRLLAATNVDQIDVLAHSMGSWVTVEAFRQIAIAGKFPVGKLGNIVFASPDIDLDVFKSQVARVGKPPKPYFVLLSRDDRALQLSSFIAGDKERLGSLADAEELTKLGAVVIDLTDVKGADGANHGKFAALAAAAPELEHLLKSEGSLDQSNASSRERIAGGAMTVISLPGQLIGAPIRILSGAR